MQDFVHQQYLRIPGPEARIPQRNPVRIDQNLRVKKTPSASIVNPKKLETGLRPNSAGIPYILLLRIEAIGFPTFGLLL